MNNITPGIGIREQINSSNLYTQKEPTLEELTNIVLDVLSKPIKQERKIIYNTDTFGMWILEANYAGVYSRFKDIKHYKDIYYISLDSKHGVHKIVYNTKKDMFPYSYYIGTKLQYHFSTLKQIHKINI